ncbi:MAG TPA: LPD38 domain-containing protein [Ramlibacter sp.]|nr:LPD38 domain-containing protein [Ramlibacter sp.]
MLNVQDPRVARMAADLKNLDGMTRLDLAASIVGKSTRWLAGVNTQYNSAFGLVKLTRDTWGGLVNLNSTRLRGRGLKVLADVPKAMVGIGWGLFKERHASLDPSALEWSRLWQQFQADGGRTGYRDLFTRAEERALQIERELRAAGPANAWLVAKRAGRWLLNLLDGFNMALENAVRLAAYKEAIDRGMARPEAARLGRELTVDFNRKGRSGRELSPLYAFFNASVQGGARTIQTLKGENGRAIIAGGLTLGVIQALLLLAAGYDDDEIPEFVKSRSLIIPLPKDAKGEKRFLQVPYPLGLHVLPNTGRVLTELGLSGGRDLSKKVVGAIGELASAFNPLGGGDVTTMHGVLTTAPTVVDPLIDVMANQNFAGQPIEREAFRGELDNRPGFARVRERTQRELIGQAYLEISKAINAATGGTQYERGLASPTPERVRYIAQTVGGGVLRELEKAVNSTHASLQGDEVKLSGVPVLGRFKGEVNPDRVTQNRYWERSKVLDKLQSSMTAAKNAGDAEALVRLGEKPEARMIRAHDQMQRKLAQLNRLAVSVVNDPMPNIIQRH